MPRMLVADDDPVICHMLTILFTSEGFSVSTVNTGVALIAHATADRPDLVLTDVEMPGLNGIAATRQFRTDPRTATLPIIVQSGNVTYQWDAHAAGASVFLVKPVRLDELIATVQQLLVKKEVPCTS